MVESNSILYEKGEKPDHCVVIKYVPYVGDSKRALDEYTSEIFMHGLNTIVLHNTCEVFKLRGNQFSQGCRNYNVSVKNLRLFIRLAVFDWQLKWTVGERAGKDPSSISSFDHCSSPWCKFLSLPSFPLL